MSDLRIATFRKVSFEQFYRDYKDMFGHEQNAIKVRKIYDNIFLPIRSTKGSAGYDFKSPIDFNLCPGETIIIPTGVRAEIDEGWGLMLYPRSSLGFKYRLQLDNTVGVIDSDYFYSRNEGHILIKLTNGSNKNKIIAIKAGDGIIQGIFQRYGITSNDVADGIRNGGFGSTGR